MYIVEMSGNRIRLMCKRATYLGLRQTFVMSQSVARRLAARR